MPLDLPPKPQLILPLSKPALVRAASLGDVALQQRWKQEHLAAERQRQAMLLVTQLTGFNAAKFEPPVVTTFVAAPSTVTDQASNTFAVNFGAAGLYQHVFIGAAGRSGGGGNTVSSLTVDSNAAVERAHLESSGNSVALWNLAYSAGGTVDVVVNWSGTESRAGIVVWGTTGLQSLVPTAGPITDTGDPVQAAINIAAGGVVFVIAGTAATTSGTAVGSGFGEDADYVIADGTAHTVWGGHGDFAAAQTGLTVGCDFATGGTAPIMCGAAFR